MEHLIGWIILGASFVLTTAFVIFRIVSFRKRWDVDRYGGTILVRFAHGAKHTEALGRSLDSGLEVLLRAIRDRFPSNPELLDFRIEIVPPGKVSTPTVPSGRLPDGSLVGGSIRTERMFPITRKHHVAVVVDERTTAFITHEVTRHILPFRVLGNPDPFHQYADFAALETLVKERQKGPS